MLGIRTVVFKPITNLSKLVFQVIYQFLLSFGFPHYRWHLLLQMADDVRMYLCCSCPFHKLIYLLDRKQIWLNPIRGEGLKEEMSTLTRRSQAFFGMSFKSARRSSCSFSNNSLPIGPVAASFMGLSLKELFKASK